MLTVSIIDVATMLKYLYYCYYHSCLLHRYQRIQSFCYQSALKKVFFLRSQDYQCSGISSSSSSSICCCVVAIVVVVTTNVSGIREHRVAVINLCSERSSLSELSMCGVPHSHWLPYVDFILFPITV